MKKIGIGKYININKSKILMLTLYEAKGKNESERQKAGENNKQANKQANKSKQRHSLFRGLGWVDMDLDSGLNWCGFENWRF